jgi:hypothetical protein
MLKKYFMEALISQHFEPVWPVVIETDASDLAIGAVLFQVIDGQLYPVAYHSRKMDKAKIKLEIYDKELLTIVSAFNEWRHYLKGAAYPISVFTVHKNLEYFATIKILNQRHTCWAQELAGYHLNIFYKPGSTNGNPEALSRSSEHRPRIGSSSAEENQNQPIHPILSSDELVTSEGGTVQVMAMKLRGKLIAISSAILRAIPVVKFNSWLLEAVVSATNTDATWQQEYVRAMGGNLSPDISFKDEALYYECRLCIPDDLQLKKLILEVEHNSKMAGHMGHDKTIELVRLKLFYLEMEKFIEDDVCSCPECQKNKAAQHAHYGLLQPQEMAYCKWHSISMDFIIELPVSNGCPSVKVFLKQFMKIAHFIPLNDGEKKDMDLVKIFLKEVWRFNGLPLNMVSDQNSRVTSAFSSSLVKACDIRLKISSPFHPQTDGLTK